MCYLTNNEFLSVSKHLGLCLLLFAIVGLSMLACTLNQSIFQNVNQINDPPNIFIFILKCFSSTSPLLCLPLAIFLGIGFVFRNYFFNNITLNTDLESLPFIGFRVVTRGNCSDLLRENLERNVEICIKTGLKDFIFEIVTESAMPSITNSKFVRQILVPKDYRTAKNTLYKARNLQYCLEDGVSALNDEDWIVHMDEDVLLTYRGLIGIANFISTDKHSFGQGFSNRISSKDEPFYTDILDLALTFEAVIIPFQFKVFNQSICIIKGSFLIAKVKSEKIVSFDVSSGPSLLEDVAFGVKACLNGFTFGYVEGYFLEQGSITFKSSFNQILRSMSGLFHIFKSSFFSVRKCKVFFLFYVSLISLPLFLIDLMISYFYPVHSCLPILLIKGFEIGILTYISIFTVFLRSQQQSLFNILCRLFISCTIGPFFSVLQTLYGLFFSVIYYNRVKFNETPKRFVQSL